MIKSRLKILLAERNMNLVDLSEMTGIPYTTARRFTYDHVTAIHKVTLNLICAALGVGVGDVFVYVPDAADADTVAPED